MTTEPRTIDGLMSLDSYLEKEGDLEAFQAQAIREVLSAEEFSDADLALIGKSEPPVESAKFNHELDE